MAPDDDLALSRRAETAIGLARESAVERRERSELLGRVVRRLHAQLVEVLIGRLGARGRRGLHSEHLELTRARLLAHHFVDARDDAIVAKHDAPADEELVGELLPRGFVLAAELRQLVLSLGLLGRADVLDLGLVPAARARQRRSRALGVDRDVSQPTAEHEDLAARAERGELVGRVALEPQVRFDVVERRAVVRVERLGVERMARIERAPREQQPHRPHRDVRRVPEMAAPRGAARAAARRARARRQRRGFLTRVRSERRGG